MKENKLRTLLREGKPSVSTRLWSTWPFYMEALGATGLYDYAEFVGEYAPFTGVDLENLARAAELHEMGSMIKLDYLDCAYQAQKAAAAGFQAILFADHRSAEQVRATIRAMKSDTPEQGGLYGCPARRFIGTQSHLSQLAHAARVNEVVLCFMIEKAEAMADIEAICATPGVDMVQFGPADYSMSRGWNAAEHREETRAAEREMIRVAHKHGVAARCEIATTADAAYYRDLGVRHFSLGDQFKILHDFWTKEGGALRQLADALGSDK